MGFVGRFRLLVDDERYSLPHIVKHAQIGKTLLPSAMISRDSGTLTGVFGEKSPCIAATDRKSDGDGPAVAVIVVKRQKVGPMQRPLLIFPSPHLPGV